MAAPVSLRLFKPVRVWFAVTASALALLVAAAANILWISTAENRRLVRLEAGALVRAHVYDLERGDYRAFVEGAGQDFSDLSIEIRAGDAAFTAGAPSRRGHCESSTVPVIGRGVREVLVTVCRSSNAPVAELAGVIAAFILVSGAILVILRRLERGSTGALIRFFHDFGVEVDGKGGLVGLLAKVRDLVGELRRAQNREIELVRASAYAVTARQVAHDIRSPLATLKVALGDLTAGPGAAIAAASMARIEAIADDLIERARGESGAAAPARLWPVVEAAAREASVLSDGRLRIEPTSTDAARAARVRFEPNDAARVLANLLNNAREASPDGGRVAIALEMTADAVVCRIHDDGRGIAPEILPRLMQRGATFGKAGGSGLGLFHARQTLESWGARLEIESAPGLGTSVILRFPVVAPAAIPAKTAAVAAEVDTILVDDDVWVREAWEHAAKRDGWRLRTYERFADLEHDLDGLSRSVPIYLDLDLDGASGDDAAERLAALGFTTLYSASGHGPEASRCAGIYRDFIGKEPPFSAEFSE